jgi:hypothetical protein
LLRDGLELTGSDRFCALACRRRLAFDFLVEHEAPAPLRLLWLILASHLVCREERDLLLLARPLEAAPPGWEGGCDEETVLAALNESALWPITMLEATITTPTIKRQPRVAKRRRTSIMGEKSLSSLT